MKFNSQDRKSDGLSASFELIDVKLNLVDQKSELKRNQNLFEVGSVAFNLDSSPESATHIKMSKTQQSNNCLSAIKECDSED